MSSRRYDQLIDFEARVPVTEDTGQIREDWKVLLKRRGHVQQTSASEGQVNQQHQYAESYTIFLPFDPDANRLNPMETRIVWHSRTGDVILNIIGRDVSGTGRTPELILYTTLDK